MGGSIVKAHQHAEIAIGKSVAGIALKFNLGNPIHFEITEGQVHDIQKAETLLTVSDGESLGYISATFAQQVEDTGKVYVISKKTP